MLYSYLDAFSTDRDFADFWPEYSNLDALKDAYPWWSRRYEVQKLLNSVINRMLDPIRERRHEFRQDIPEIFPMSSRRVVMKLVPQPHRQWTK